MSKIQLASNQDIKSITTHNIKHINQYFKKHFAHEPVLQNVPVANSLTEDKQALHYINQHQYQNGDGIHPKKNISKQRWTQLSKAGNQLYLKFDNQFLLNTARHYPNLKMSKAQLQNMNNDHTNNIPAKFSATDIKTGKQEEKDLVTEITKHNHIITHTTFKDKLNHQLDGLAKLVQKHPWKPGTTPLKAFVKYPDAMKTLDMTDQHYYKDASKQMGMNKNEPIINGVYPISSPDDNFLNNAHTDIVTPKELLAHINDFQETAISSLASSDLKDIENGNDDNMYGTTSPNFQETDYQKLYQRRSQQPNTTLDKYQKLIQNNQLQPQNYGTYLDQHPKLAKSISMYSGKQAQKHLKHNISKESHWMATSNLNEPLSNVKTVANLEKTDKNLLKQIKPNRAYTYEQVSDIGATPNTKIESLGKKAMQQNLKAFVADERHEQIAKHVKQSILNKRPKFTHNSQFNHKHKISTVQSKHSVQPENSNQKRLMKMKKNLNHGRQR